MAERFLLEIIELCIELESKAAGLYQRFAGWAESATLDAFWRSMADDELRHVQYWRRLMDLAQSGALPQVFENPDEVRGELEAIRGHVESLLQRGDRSSTTDHAFLIAYRLEFYMLHSTFMKLFHLLDTITGEPAAEEDYEGHIDRFVQALGRHTRVSPELELLGEAILRMWRENRQLAALVSQDPLTGLLNRRGLLTAMKPLSHLAKRRGEAVGVMMVDVDHFKEINDTVGHQAGDRALVTVARAIDSRLRKSDLVGRYGGEEFLVFLPTVAPDSLEKIAEGLRRSVEEHSAAHIPLTVSIGVSFGVFQRDVEKELTLLIARADDCMYRAKRAGRNRVVCWAPEGDF